jgi:hypothetical protein
MVVRFVERPVVVERVGSRAARILAAARVVLVLAGLGVFALVADRHYPLRHWLFFLYARAWAMGLLFVAASLAAGARLLGWLLPEPGPLGERLSISFALGVLVFGLGIFVGGLCGLYGVWFFFLWPAALLAFGGRALFASARRTLARLGRFGIRLVQPRGLAEGIAVMGLAVGLGAVYLVVITPSNQGGDAHMYHLPIAEHYAAAGRIAPFAEGWYQGAYPQLASILYTWAFLAPGTLFYHVTLAAHLEWFLFLATVAGIAPLARRLLGGVRVPYAGVVMLAFPGLYLYDSSLITQSDHVLAFWAAPLALALLRLCRWFAAREAIAVGLLAAGAFLTKYQALYLLAPAALAVLWRAARARRAGPALAAAAAGLLATSPHWLKNLIYYGDPLYPMLHGVLRAHPFHARAAALLVGHYVPNQFTLEGTLAQKLVATAKTLATFSFVPNDWMLFHGERPVFGSLFTLLLPALVLVRARRRVWLLAGGIQLGIAIWYVTNHQDRYLQALLPWMAACTAALLVLLWRAGGPALRASLAALIAFQVVWGADVFFIGTHAMLGQAPIKRLADHLAAGNGGHTDDRFRIWGGLQDVGKTLPPGAVVLAHGLAEKLGLGAPAIVDTDGWQGGIDYLACQSPRATAELWRRLRVTHVVWREDHPALDPSEVGAEAVVAHALELFGAETQHAGGLAVTRLAPPDAHLRAPASVPTRLVWIGCGSDPPAGVYTPAGLTGGQAESAFSPVALASHPGLAAVDTGVPIVAMRSACPEARAAEGEMSAAYRRLITAGELALWVRAP